MKWLDEPEFKDFPAAEHYLSLIFSPTEAKSLSSLLRKAETVEYEAKDILRASCLPLLDEDNEHVKKDLKKIDNDEPLSPVLLVRGQPLIIADGYHRVCASYHRDENTSVPCKIV